MLPLWSMGMGKDHRVDISRVEWKVQVHPIGFLAPALEHTAVQQQFAAFVSKETSRRLQFAPPKMCSLISAPL